MDKKSIFTIDDTILYKAGELVEKFVELSKKYGAEKAKKIMGIGDPEEYEAQRKELEELVKFLARL